MQDAVPLPNMFSFVHPRLGAVHLRVVVARLRGDGMAHLLVRAVDPIPVVDDREVVFLYSAEPELDRFTLDGCRYYQQYRTCGKKMCWCAGAVPFGHGPYWCCRDAGGKIISLGVDLPHSVKVRRAGFFRAENEISSLQDRLMVLSRYVIGKSLSERDKELLCLMGYDGF